jgi:hypothetical protein
MQTPKRPPAPPAYRPNNPTTQRRPAASPIPALIGPPVYRPQAPAPQPPIYRPQAVFPGLQPKRAPVAHMPAAFNPGIVQRAAAKVSYAALLGGVGGSKSGGTGGGSGGEEKKPPPEKPFEEFVSKGAKKKAKKAVAVSALAEQILNDASARLGAWDRRSDLNISWPNQVSRAVCQEVFDNGADYDFQVAPWREVAGQSTVNLWVQGLGGGALGRAALFNYHVYKS